VLTVDRMTENNVNKPHHFNGFVILVNSCVSEKSDIDKQTLAIGERETWSDGSRFSVIENGNNLTIIPRYSLEYRVKNCDEQSVFQSVLPSCACFKLLSNATKR